MICRLINIRLNGKTENSGTKNHKIIKWERSIGMYAFLGKYK